MKIGAKKLYSVVGHYEFTDALDFRKDSQHKNERKYRKKIAKLCNKRIRRIIF